MRGQRSIWELGPTVKWKWGETQNTTLISSGHPVIMGLSEQSNINLGIQKESSRDLTGRPRQRNVQQKPEVAGLLEGLK